jgi:hypothetical protein
MMAEQMLHPTPPSRWEKAYDIAAPAVPLFIGLSAGPSLSRMVGLWPALAIVLLGAVVLMLILARLVAPLKKARRAKDAEQGLFPCWFLDDKPALGSSKRRWSMGYAQVQDDTLSFQATIGTSSGPGSLVGAVKTFSNLAPLDMPNSAAKAPWPIRKSPVISLDTDKGPIDLAVSETGLKLLAAHYSDRGNPNRPGTSRPT